MHWCPLLMFSLVKFALRWMTFTRQNCWTIKGRSPMMTVADSPNVLIEQLNNFKNMTVSCIEHGFDEANLRFKPDKSLLISLRLCNLERDYSKHDNTLDIMLWAPCNYVAVFYNYKEEYKSEGELKFCCYHDSGWRGSLRDLITQYEGRSSSF